MTNYREILRLKKLGLNNSQIAQPSHFYTNIYNKYHLKKIYREEAA